MSNEYRPTDEVIERCRKPQAFCLRSTEEQMAMKWAADRNAVQYMAAAGDWIEDTSPGQSPGWVSRIRPDWMPPPAPEKNPIRTFKIMVASSQHADSLLAMLNLMAAETGLEIDIEVGFYPRRGMEEGECVMTVTIGGKT